MTDTIQDDPKIEQNEGLVLPMPGEMKKTNSIDKKKICLRDMQNAEAPTKTDAEEVSVKDKLMRAFGMRREVSPVKNANKLSLFSDREGAETDFSLQRTADMLKAPGGPPMKKVPGETAGDTHLMRDMKTDASALDNGRLTQRLIELENHVKEVHSSFDDFVLRSDQFLNYEQFLDVQNEVKEKIRLLDTLEKSLEESKNMILKDAGYMDQILEGFSHNKKKIESLESRLDAISGQMSANNSLQQNKYAKIALPINAKSSEQLKAPESAIAADLKKELEVFKKNDESRQNDFLKVMESMSSFDKKMNKISCDMDTSKKMIDDINRKIRDFGDQNEKFHIDALRMQINDIAKRLADVDKRPKAGNEVHLEAISNKDVEEKIRKECNDLKASLKSEFDIQINALKQAMQKSADNKAAEFPAKKNIERMNAEMSEVRANIDRIKTALHGL